MIESIAEKYSQYLKEHLFKEPLGYLIRLLDLYYQK